MLKKLIFSALFLFSSISLFSEPTPEELNILNSNNSDFSKVLTGVAVCRPANLSIGTAIVTDARSFICLSNDGKTLWERKLRFSSDAKLFPLHDDFILVTTKNDTNISVYNSSGILIFQKELEQKLNDSPVQGFDGRIILPLQNKIKCYSIAGTEKWTLENKSGEKIYFLKDGSFIIPENNCLKRYSPFGEALDEIELEKETEKILQGKEGIFIINKDKSVSWYTCEANKLQNKWISQVFAENIPENFTHQNLIYCENSPFSIFYGFTKKNLHIYYFDEKNGIIKNSIQPIPIKQNTLPSDYKLETNSVGILVIDTETACFYDNYGTLAWKKTLSETKEEQPVYCILKNNNSLIFFCENWSINYFTIIKKDSFAEKDNYHQKKNYSIFYSDVYSNSEILFSGNFNSLTKDFLKGDFHNKEKYYISTLLDFYQKYTSTLTSSDFGTIELPTQFEQDISANIQLINLSFNMQSDEFSDYIVEIIRSEKNPAVLKGVLSGIGKFGYDRDLRILNEIMLRSKKITPREENLIPFLCDATVSICKFMGKNAFEKYGNQIIKTFFSEQFSPEAKQVSRNAYLKISKFFQYN